MFFVLVVTLVPSGLSAQLPTSLLEVLVFSASVHNCEKAIKGYASSPRGSSAHHWYYLNFCIIPAVFLYLFTETKTPIDGDASKSPAVSSPEKLAGMFKNMLFLLAY